MKKVLLVMSLISVLLLTGCNSNNNENVNTDYEKLTQEISKKDETIRELENQINELKKSNTDELKSNSFDLSEQLESLNYSNSLLFTTHAGTEWESEWKISSDGKTIEKRSQNDQDDLKLFNTNLSKNIKSFRVGYIDTTQTWIFLALTENGELYMANAHEGNEVYFDDLIVNGCNGIAELGYYGANYFIARTTEVEDVNSFVDYTIFSNADNKFTFYAGRP